MNSQRQYIQLYNDCRTLLSQYSAPVLDAVRDSAYEQFCNIGIPTQKVERYKYTDMQALFAKEDYGLNLKRLQIPVNPYDAFRCDVPNLSTLLYFVVNDIFYDKLLPKSSLPQGVIVGSLKKEALRQPQLIGKYYAAIAKSEDDGITALNTMLAQDGLLVYVPAHTKVERTIQVINILRSDVDLMANRRVLIIVEEGAEANLLFCDHAADNRDFLTTQVVEVYVGRGACLNIYNLEETHSYNKLVSNTYIKQETDSRLTHLNITLHNGITRSRTDLLLNGEGAECELLGCVIADKDQRADHNTLITHRAGHCNSHQLYKYVLDGNAVGAFAGKVLVEKGAQDTCSEETNQNLCASKTARMFTQPMLEIYTDNVKCSHGSTVGQMNDAALFYMQQRGISYKEARLLLEVAFINEVINQIRLTPLHDRLHYLIDKRFRGELNKCEGCRLCK